MNLTSTSSSVSGSSSSSVSGSVSSSSSSSVRTPLRFNASILFSKSKTRGGRVASQEITDLLKRHHAGFTFNEISDILCISAKNKYILSPIQLQYLVYALRATVTEAQEVNGKGVSEGTRILRNNTSNIKISKFFNGLKVHSSDNKVVRDLLRDAHTFISLSSNKLKPFRGEEIGLMVYGFQRMQSRHAEVRSVVEYFAHAIRECKEQLSARDLSILFYGMNHLDTQHSEVGIYMYFRLYRMSLL